MTRSTSIPSLDLRLCHGNSCTAQLGPKPSARPLAPPAIRPRVSAAGNPHSQSSVPIHLGHFSPNHLGAVGPGGEGTAAISSSAVSLLPPSPPWSYSTRQPQSPCHSSSASERALSTLRALSWFLSHSEQILVFRVDNNRALSLTTVSLSRSFYVTVPMSVRPTGTSGHRRLLCPQLESSSQRHLHGFPLLPFRSLALSRQLTQHGARPLSLPSVHHDGCFLVTLSTSRQRTQSPADFVGSVSFPRQHGRSPRVTSPSSGRKSTPEPHRHLTRVC